MALHFIETLYFKQDHTLQLTSCFGVLPRRAITWTELVLIIASHDKLWGLARRVFTLLCFQPAHQFFHSECHIYCRIYHFAHCDHFIDHSTFSHLVIAVLLKLIAKGGILLALHRKFSLFKRRFKPLSCWSYSTVSGNFLSCMNTLRQKASLTHRCPID